jgi:hypothetical protein
VATFKCIDCGEEKPLQTNGGTGRALTDAGESVCYACCAVRDRAYMVEHGRITLYLTLAARPQAWGGLTRAGTVSNWPGTLNLGFDLPVTLGRHNIAGRRYDVWFDGPDGHKWHGVTYGDNTQICHCKRTKRLVA